MGKVGCGAQRRLPCTEAPGECPQPVVPATTGPPAPWARAARLARPHATTRAWKTPTRVRGQLRGLRARPRPRAARLGLQAAPSPSECPGRGSLAGGRLPARRGRGLQPPPDAKSRHREPKRAAGLPAADSPQRSAARRPSRPPPSRPGAARLRRANKGRAAPVPPAPSPRPGGAPPLPGTTALRAPAPLRACGGRRPGSC